MCVFEPDTAIWFQACHWDLRLGKL